MVANRFSVRSGAALVSDRNDAYPLLYGLPHKCKKLTDSLAVGDAPAVVYPASKVDSVVVRADMESASPMRQSIRTAGKLPEVLSASISVG